MDDREIVAALAAGDPDGVAAAYDAYAESIYGYCQWMLAEPDDAAEAVRDTFVLAARELGRRLRDATKMRLWLFRTARSECLRRPRAVAGADGAFGAPDTGSQEAGSQEAGSQEAGSQEAGSQEAGSQEAGSQEAGSQEAGSQEAGDLRRLIRATLATLTADEREAVELSLWHDFDDTDVAAMLGVSPERAYALVGNARWQLEKTLGALRIARTRRAACPELDTLLAGHDERLTVPVLNLVGQHVAQCEACGNGKPGSLRPEALTRLLPLAEPPADLREQVLELAAAGLAGAAGTGASGTGASGTGASGTGASGTGASGTGASGTGASGAAGDPPLAPEREPAPIPVTAGRSSRAGAGLAIMLAGWGQRGGRVKAAAWNLVRRSPRATIAALAILVVVAAGVMLITTNDAHAARNLGALSGGATAGASDPAGTSGAGTIADPGTNTPPSAQHSGQASPGPASFLAPSASPSEKVTPARSPRSASPGSSTVPSPSASASPPPPSSSPLPTRTHSASPSPTATDSPTPTASPTPTDSPTPSSSATPTDTAV
jgi:RNA polymerase sigma factor (sigma-70 family)